MKVADVRRETVKNRDVNEIRALPEDHPDRVRFEECAKNLFDCVAVDNHVKSWTQLPNSTPLSSQAAALLEKLRGLKREILNLSAA